MAAIPHGPDPLIKNSENHGSYDKNAPCKVCLKYLNERKFHRHFSSKYFYDQLAMNKAEKIDCPSCKVKHYLESQNEREIIIYASSILFDAYKSNLYRSPIHINFELICGGKIDQFSNLFIQQYANNRKPMDIILCTGVNDIQNASEDAIIRKFEKFYEVTLKSNPKNRVFVLRMIRPPSIYSFSENDVGVRKTKIIVDRVNSYLKKKNCDIGNPDLPNLTSLGTIVATARKHKYYLKRWRERNLGIEKCVHLTDDLRAIICRKILQFVRIRLVGAKEYDKKFPHEG